MTSTQAAADHAIVAATLAAEAAAAGVPAQPIITFGGSYGGMLSAWLRFKYPATFAGAIAASAPVAFFIGQVPAYDPESYWRVVTADATAAHGAAPACAANVRAAFAAIYAAGATAAGRDNLTKTFDLCSPLLSPADVDDMAVTLHLNAWDTIAMGNFPYESNYLTGGGPLLPAWPVRAACEALADPALGRAADPWPLLAAFNAAGAVFNNATQNLACYAWDTDYWLDGDWDYQVRKRRSSVVRTRPLHPLPPPSPLPTPPSLPSPPRPPTTLPTSPPTPPAPLPQWCTENIPEESYFTTDGVHDMFQPRAFNASFVTQHCFDKWGVRPRYSWMTESYGNVWDWARAGASNIVFSNGNYDPWSSAGVNASLSPSLPAVLIDTGAHHLDLFFSNPADPPSVIAARDVELGYIKAWVKEFSSKRSAEL